MVNIEPPSVDQRIINQYSFFSVVPSGIDCVDDFFRENTTNTVRFIIKKELRWDARDLLDQYNVNERMVYPGLDGLTKWLVRHYYVKRWGFIMDDKFIAELEVVLLCIGWMVLVGEVLR